MHHLSSFNEFYKTPPMCRVCYPRTMYQDCPDFRGCCKRLDALHAAADARKSSAVILKKRTGSSYLEKVKWLQILTITCSRDTSQFNKIRKLQQKGVFVSKKYAALHGKLGASSQANRGKVERALDQRHRHARNCFARTRHEGKCFNAQVDVEVKCYGGCVTIDII